jgi:hypothetical protein
MSECQTKVKKYCYIFVLLHLSVHQPEHYSSHIYAVIVQHFLYFQ